MRKNGAFSQNHSEYSKIWIENYKERGRLFSLYLTPEGCPFLNFILFEISDGEAFIDILRETAKININILFRNLLMITKLDAT